MIFNIERIPLVPQRRQIKDPPFKVRVLDDNGNFVRECTVTDLKELNQQDLSRINDILDKEYLNIVTE